MPRKPKRRIVHHDMVDVNATITPNTSFSVPLSKAVMIVAGCLIAGSGYAFMVFNQSSTHQDVVEIKSSVASNAALTQSIVKDQDDKRAQLAKEFLASQDKIVDSVNKLTTLVAVQQERQKSTDDKLEKVLSQISGALGKH